LFGVNLAINFEGNINKEPSKISEGDREVMNTTSIPAYSTFKE